MNDAYAGLNLKLGKNTQESGLDPIPRALGRQQLGKLPTLYGADLWNAYEVSFLSPSGKPVIYHMQALYDAQSPSMVESKSFKLYLNGFNQQTFENLDSFAKRVNKDISTCVEAPVSLHFYELDHSPERRTLPGFLIDRLDLIDLEGKEGAALLKRREKEGAFAFSSHLLRSNCPVTNQPDWGAVALRGRGKATVEASSVLAYLVSMRNHQDFHESCCEMIYRDLFHLLEPEELEVRCYYTRRGGLDINPIRSSNPDFEIRLESVWRQ